MFVQKKKINHTKTDNIFNKFNLKT